MLLIVKALAWLRGGSLLAGAVPYLATAAALFFAGWAYGSARADRSAEVAALRSEIAAHEIANGLREVAAKQETEAAQAASEADTANAAVISEQPNTDEKTVPPTFDGAFLERLRRIR